MSGSNCDKRVSGTRLTIPLRVAANCKKLIACSEALSPGTGAAMQTSYGKDGACWKNGDSAAACTAACDTAMSTFKSMPAFATTDACK